MITKYEALTLWPIGVVIIGLLILFVVRLLESAGSHDPSFSSAYTRFMEDAKARGLSYQDSMMEWDVRSAFHRFRREASAAVAGDPGNWQKGIDDAQQAAFTRMSMQNPDHLPHFGAMVRGLSYGDILYPEQAKLVDRLVDVPASAPTLDQRGALRIVK